MKIRPMFALYDAWIGFFWDGAKRRLYFFPIPFFGFCIQLAAKRPAPVEIDWDRALLDAGGFGKRIEPAKHVIHRVGAPCLFCDDGPKKSLEVKK